MRKIRKRDLQSVYGIDLPLGKHRVYPNGDSYKIFSVKDDTDGCILPGMEKHGDTITHSRVAFELIFADIRDAIEQGEEVWIEIKDSL